MTREHVVLVSQIPLWSMGAATGGPAFRETLTHLGRRFDVSLVAPELEYVDPSALPEGVTLHTFAHRLHGVARSVPKIGWVTDTLGWYTFRASAWPIVRRLCEERPPAFVYGYEIYGVPVARRAADRFGVPMVARFQGSLMSTRRHERLAGLRYHKHLAALATPADLVIMTDDGTLGDGLLRDLGHPSERIRFWMNGVDPAVAASAITGADARIELGVAPDDLLLLTVSRLSHWKRVDRAIDTAALLRERGLPVELVVVGAGPEEAALRERAKRSAAAGHVRFIGGVPRDLLAGYYRAANLLLSLYDYSNLANPVIEAMLLGTPLLALDVGGTSNLVHDGVNGRLIAETDPVAIADVAAELLGEHDRSRGLGQQAARWAREHLWTWEERMAAEIAELERLIGGGAGC
ncbi:MAG: hypothetical protein Kow0067_02810 [Coriobacteriia bacterium]